MTDLRAGAARLDLSPPLGLPMVGFVRQPWRGHGYGLPLEVTVLALDSADRRVLLLGLDVTILRERAMDALVERLSAATGADPAGILISLNHTHLSPIADRDAAHFVCGDYPDDVRALAESYMDTLYARVESACRMAVSRLEPARVAWAVAEVDECVNRRERAVDGSTVLGWSADGLVDRRVTSLQARRPDGSAIATVVNWGCHPVTTGYDMDIYSADYPGALRRLVRATGGGECVFLQGAAGNVLPRIAFTDDEREAERVGRRLALASLTSLAGRGSGRRRAVRKPEASMVPIIAYRVVEEAGEQVLDATRARVVFPLEPLPSLTEIRELRAGFDARLAEARATGELGRIKPAAVAARWARVTEELIAGIAAGAAPPRPGAPIHAIRIGDGVLVTGPGETFTEIGLAVKERSPGAPTAYCGYANGCIGYLSIASEYPFGGYEPGTSHRGYEQPAPFAPECDRLLVETGVRLAERLFPEATPWPEDGGWLASGVVPDLPDDTPPHPGRAGAPGEPTW